MIQTFINIPVFYSQNALNPMASRIMDRSDHLDQIALSIAGISLNDAHISDTIIRSFPQLFEQIKRRSHHV